MKNQFIAFSEVNNWNRRYIDWKYLRSFYLVISRKKIQWISKWHLVLLSENAANATKHNCGWRFDFPEEPIDILREWEKSEYISFESSGRFSNCRLNSH